MKNIKSLNKFKYPKYYYNIYFISNKQNFTYRIYKKYSIRTYISDYQKFESLNLKINNKIKENNS